MSTSRPCGRPIVDYYYQQEFKGKVKASPCNVVCASSQEAETDVPSLTDSEEEINRPCNRAEYTARGRNPFGSVVSEEIRRYGGKSA